jgi:hypothetical protein
MRQSHASLQDRRPPHLQVRVKGAGLVAGQVQLPLGYGGDETRQEEEQPHQREEGDTHSRLDLPLKRRRRAQRSDCSVSLSSAVRS